MAALLVGVVIGIFSAPDYMAWIAGGICLFFWYCTYAYLSTSRSELYKHIVVPRLLRVICPNAQYAAKSQDYRDILKKAGMFDVIMKPYRWLGANTIRGCVKNKHFVYSEVEITHEVTHGRHKGQKATCFKGIIFDVECTTAFSKGTVLTTDRLFFELHSSLPLKMHYFHTGNTEFDRCFTIYTEDEHDAQAVLSPEMQSRIIQLYHGFRQRNANKDLLVSFYNGQVLFLIPTLQNNFEVKYKVEDVKKDFMVLIQLMEITEGL